MSGQDPRRVRGPGEVRFERRLPGPIERVWAHLVVPERRARWLAGGLLEPWPGGRVALAFDHAALADEPDLCPSARRCAEGEAPVVRGTVRACRAPSLLVFTWDVAGEPSSEVTIELDAAVGGRSGEVRLVLTHRRLPAAIAAGVDAGWTAHLAILDDVLADRPRRGFWRVHEAVLAGRAAAAPPGGAP